MREKVEKELKDKNKELKNLINKFNKQNLTKHILEK